MYSKPAGELVDVVGNDETPRIVARCIKIWPMLT